MRIAMKTVTAMIWASSKGRLAVTDLDNAVARRGATGADTAGSIVHADRRSQFRSRKFHGALTRHAMVGSMGQVAAAGDNAAMESFVSLCCERTCSTGSPGVPASSCGSGS